MVANILPTDTPSFHLYPWIHLAFICKRNRWDALKKNHYMKCTALAVVNISATLTSFIGDVSAGSIDVWWGARRSCWGRGFESKLEAKLIYSIYRLSWFTICDQPWDFGSKCGTWSKLRFWYFLIPICLWSIHVKFQFDILSGFWEICNSP